MMAGVCLSVRLSVCRELLPNSRTERYRKPKIGKMEAHHMSNLRIYLKEIIGQRFKGQKVEDQGHQAN